MVRDIDFGDDATHPLQKDHFFATLISEEMKFPLTHPSVILRDELF